MSSPADTRAAPCATIVELPPTVCHPMAARPIGGGPAPTHVDPDPTDGRAFHSVKPWTGNTIAPTDFVPSSELALAPKATLALDHVYGYKVRQARRNIFWVDEPTSFMYPAAAVVTVYDVAARRQKHFTGHEADVLCLDYHRESRTAASGGLGPRYEAPLFVWNVDTMKVRALIRGKLFAGVVDVAFSRDGTRVFGIGMDTQQMCGVFDASTGACLAQAVGDMNRIAGCINDTTGDITGRNASRKMWVSIGVSHVKFWRLSKGGSQLDCKKAIGSDISQQTMVGAACTASLVVVGNVSGTVYLFSDGILVGTVAAHPTYTCGMCYIPRADGPNAAPAMLLTGGRDGHMKRWIVDETKKPALTLESELDLNPHCPLSAVPPTGDGNGNVGVGRANAPRAIDARSSTGYVLVGTELGEVYIVHPAGTSVEAVVKSHFDSRPASNDEIRDIAVHPTEPLFASVGDNACIGLWSAELRNCVVMRFATYPATTCAFAPDGGSIAVGHANGCFSVWDGVTLAPLVQFTRKRTAECTKCRFSPNGFYLAVSMGLAKVVDLYDAKRGFIPVREFNVDCGIARTIDWNADSTIITFTTHSYEQLWFDVYDGMRINLTQTIADEEWDTQTGIVGWGVQGIWEHAEDGSDVNALSVNPDRDLLAVACDDRLIRLFKFPCLVRQALKGPSVQFPRGRAFHGHGHQANTVVFSNDGRYVYSTGGMDLTIIQWRVVRRAADLNDSDEDADDALRTASLSDLQKAQSTQEREEESFVQKIERGRILELTKARSTGILPSGAAATGGSTRNAPASASATRTRTMDYSYVTSRLLDTTASMAEKARYGRAQADHARNVADSRKRFSTFF